MLFCIDVTFEMRTVLYRIRLFIENIKMSDRIFISNGDCGKRAGQRRDRERVCVRGSTLQKRRDGVSHKLNSQKKYTWQNNVGLISKICRKLMMLLPQLASVHLTKDEKDKCHLGKIPGATTLSIMTLSKIKLSDSSILKID